MASIRPSMQGGRPSHQALLGEAECIEVPTGNPPKRHSLEIDEDDAPDLEDGRGIRKRKGKKARQLWEVFPGRSKYCCGGMMMTGDERNSPVPCVSNLAMEHLFLWLGVFILYVGLAVSIFKDHHNNSLVPWLLMMVGLVSICSICFTSYTDPGIIPRRQVILQIPGLADELKETLGYDVLGNRETEPTGIADIDINIMVPPELQRLRYRWCRTCEIVRPPLGAHCRDCDNCVLKLDHHCPFMNNCIGQRNYGFFFLSTSSLAIFFVGSLSYCLLRLSDQGNTLIQDLERYGGNYVRYFLMVVMLGLLAGAVFLVGLVTYHLFLICTGQTTKQHWKGLKDVKEDVNKDVNACSRRGPKLVNPHAWIEDPDLLRASEVNMHEYARKHLQEHQKEYERQLTTGPLDGALGNNASRNGATSSKTTYRELAAEADEVDKKAKKMDTKVVAVALPAGGRPDEDSVESESDSLLNTSSEEKTPEAKNEDNKNIKEGSHRGSLRSERIITATKPLDEKNENRVILEFDNKVDDHAVASGVNVVSCIIDDATGGGGTSCSLEFDDESTTEIEVKKK